MRLRRLNRWQAEDLCEELADLYVESFHLRPSEGYRSRSREEFLHRLSGDIRRPGFAMVITESTALVGCAVGFPVRSDDLWWLGFDGALPRSIEQLTKSDNAFAINRILVAPHEQDDDIARRLQQRLLTDHQASLGVTLVDQADHPSLAAFRSWGWRDIGEVRRPTGPTVFRALVLPLREPTTMRLDGLARHAWTRWPG
ncbi:hypothetical protein OH805_35260 [Streptomyces sp. NBC_00879]|uniref:hypothetical protein n=1 Tax=Streptomyces sp. NBC_00879 TaxID=2975855 RepID=UPI00386911A7|nr:hypothetical protein OH805_35260 [Streptomyces sp. NBC_00879]